MNIILSALLGSLIMYVMYLLYQFVTATAEVQHEKDRFSCIHTATMNGWVYNEHVRLWSNRYEPFQFTTDAMIEFARENYIIKSPAIKQG